MADGGSDRELLGRAAAGDHAAFTGFVRRHRAAVWRFARAATRSVQDAEDVLQQTFLAAWGAAADARAEHGARPWLFGIARNAVRRQGRRRAGEPVSMESLEGLGEAAGFGDEACTPEALAVVLEERELLREALAALADEEREVIVLRDLEGLSGEQAAAVLGLELGALKSRLHRARLRLAGELYRRVRDPHAAGGGA